MYRKIHNFLKWKRSINCHNGYGVQTNNVRFDQFVQDVADGIGKGEEYDETLDALCRLEAQGIITYHWNPADDEEIVSLEVED